jgi:hypothetical protein
VADDGLIGINSNDIHRHSGIAYVTPAQRHAGEDRALLGARHALYQQARQSNPRRWSGPTRDWTPIATVTLNPERNTTIQVANQLSGSTGATAFPSRPGNALATARGGGDGRRAATRSHAQRAVAREHGEDGEHRTFSDVSTVAHSTRVGGPAHQHTTRHSA